MEKKKETFTYTYSAKDQEKIKNIRQKYLPKEEDKMEQLLKLDESATKPGMIAAVSVGVISALILGVGMCCTMVWTDKLFLPGIVIGILGIVGMMSAYPLYTHMTKKRREKLAPEIMRLTDELMR